MTRIKMYINVADRLRLLYSLLSRHILPRGMRAFVFVGSEEEAAQVDRYLWTAVPGEFLPHARAESEAAADSPAVVGTGEPEAAFHNGVLVSWAAEAPPFFGRFDSLVDIVHHRPQDTQAARVRYQWYQSHGYEIDINNMSK